MILLVTCLPTYDLQTCSRTNRIFQNQNYLYIFSRRVIKSLSHTNKCKYYKNNSSRQANPCIHNLNYFAYWLIQNCILKHNYDYLDVHFHCLIFLFPFCLHCYVLIVYQSVALLANNQIEHYNHLPYTIQSHPSP